MININIVNQNWLIFFTICYYLLLFRVWSCKTKYNLKSFKNNLTYIVLKIIFENNKIKFVSTIKTEILEEIDVSPKIKIDCISKNVTITEETDGCP